MADLPAEIPGVAEAFLPAHLYIHVPFCASKCDYCDFYSLARADRDVITAVFTAIRAQVCLWSSSGLDGVLDTVYFGGGTPTVAIDEVVETLDYVREHLVLHPAAEITVEGNPDSIDDVSVARLADAGVTRVSVGVQSFDDHVLRVLGRRHDVEAAWRACRSVVGSGLDLSVDLMCGVPGQTITSWSETLNRAADTGACHASVYPLSVEQETPLDVAISAGLLREPDDDVQAEMMIMAEEALSARGLSRYEVANYAAGAKHRSRHNTAYWTGSSYIGVGPAAHGMLDAPTAKTVGFLDHDSKAVRVRYSNAADVATWFVGQGDATEELDANEAAREDVMLGLRLADGVGHRLVVHAGLESTMDELAREGLVTEARGTWRTTRKGWLLGNEVFGRVWTAAT